MSTFTKTAETVFQKTGYKAETTWGVAAATGLTRLAYMDAEISPKMESQAHTFTGTLLPSHLSTGRKWTEVKLSGLANCDEISAFITNIVSNQGSNPNAFTLQQAGPDNKGVQIAGAVVSGWGMEGDPDDIKMTVNMIGKPISNITSHGISAEPSVKHIFNGSNTTVRLGGVDVTRVFGWSVSVSNMWKPVYYIGSTEPASIAQTVIEGSFNIKAEIDAGLLAKYITDPGEVAVAIGNTTGNKALSISFNARLEEPDTFADEGGVYAVGIKGKIMHAATGNAVTVAVTDVQIDDGDGEGGDG